MDQDKSKKETPEDASPSGSEQKTAEIIDNDGKKGEGAVTDELGIEPKLEVPEGSEEEVSKPETAADVLQLMHDKIKQKLYSKEDLELLVDDPVKMIIDEVVKACPHKTNEHGIISNDIMEIIVAAYFQQLILNAEGGQKLNNEVLANKVTNDILLTIERFLAEDKDFTTLEAAHLLTALKGVK
jgi:hypothetical protein